MLAALSPILADAIRVDDPGSNPWSCAFLANHRRFASTQTCVPYHPTHHNSNERSSMDRERMTVLLLFIFFDHNSCVQCCLVLS